MNIKTIGPIRSGKNINHATLDALAQIMRRAKTDAEIRSMLTQMKAVPGSLTPKAEAALFDVITHRSSIITVATQKDIVDMIAQYSHSKASSAPRITPQAQMNSLAQQLGHAKTDLERSNFVLHMEAVSGDLTPLASRELRRLIASPTNLKLSEATQRRALKFLNNKVNGPEVVEKIVEKIVEKPVCRSDHNPWAYQDSQLPNLGRFKD